MDIDTAWLPVVGYESTYRVSSDGQVWSQPRPGTGGGIVRQYPSTWGYMNVKLIQNAKSRTVAVHRLVGDAFLGPLPKGLETRHIDGDPSNNAASNLVHGTKSQNAQDRIRHGHNDNVLKTHCPANHPYSPENTRLTASGARYCLACKRDKRRAARARARAA